MLEVIAKNYVDLVFNIYQDGSLYKRIINEPNILKAYIY